MLPPNRNREKRKQEINEDESWDRPVIFTGKSIPWLAMRNELHTCHGWRWGILGA